MFLLPCWKAIRTSIAGDPENQEQEAIKKKLESNQYRIDPKEINWKTIEKIGQGMLVLDEDNMSYCLP